MRAPVRKRTQELVEEAKARDPARPVLRGEPVPGDAWDDYERALAAAAGLTSDQAKLGEFIYRTVVEVFSGGSWGRSVMERRAQIRLLRAAVHWKRTGAMPDLDDPFGDKLKSEVKDGKLRVWSLGRDGLDGGGEGECRYTGKKKDIVLEVGR